MEHEDEELLFKLYLTDRPYMRELISFEDYRRKSEYKKPHIETRDTRPKDELIQDILKIGGA